MCARLMVQVCLARGPVAAQPKRVPHLIHSASFGHDPAATSAWMMREIAVAGGRLEAAATAGVSLLNTAAPRDFDAVLFHPGGEPPASGQQKRGRLDFVRSREGQGGVHRVTDTVDAWPEYGQRTGPRPRGPVLQPSRQSLTDSPDEAGTMTRAEPPDRGSPRGWKSTNFRPWACRLMTETTDQPAPGNPFPLDQRIARSVKAPGRFQEQRQMERPQCLDDPYPKERALTDGEPPLSVSGRAGTRLDEALSDHQGIPAPFPG